MNRLRVVATSLLNSRMCIGGIYNYMIYINNRYFFKYNNFILFIHSALLLLFIVHASAYTYICDPFSGALSQCVPCPYARSLAELSLYANGTCVYETID